MDRWGYYVPPHRFIGRTGPSRLRTPTGGFRWRAAIGRGVSVYAGLRFALVVTDGTDGRGVIGNEEVVARMARNVANRGVLELRELGAYHAAHAVHVALDGVEDLAHAER